MTNPLSSRCAVLVTAFALVLVGCAASQKQDTGVKGAPSVLSLSTQEKEDFSRWLDSFVAEAEAGGLSRRSLDSLRNVQPNASVLDLDRRQPEFVRTLRSYVGSAVDKKRVMEGQALLKKHARLLAQIEQAYGVQPRFIVAFWGMETHYGQNFGGFFVPEALATLAWDQRRPDFFKAQLLQALSILEEGHIEPAQMYGSWAGAMGHFQFMPSTFRAHAVDHDRDGRIDIWRSQPDAFASAARYLAATGWKRGQTWGRQVTLPKSFNFNLADFSVSKSLHEWSRLGVTQIGGQPLPKGPGGMQGSVIVPEGVNGPAFLVYDNFRSIMDWNRSVLYAVAVGHLADRLVGAQPFLLGKVLAPPLSRADIADMQNLLNKAGYDAGMPDGVPGYKTRNAVRAFQNKTGLVPDAYPGRPVLDALRAGNTAGHIPSDP
ncbi:lytic murein transglycosylase [Haematospirillum sp. 15-248]|uniref:lytic murein transglycosylase n=1 Tax=Haematospirillum sp. 15-248 TaxID=2723107 RepID=UPI00143A37A5|nr:lytic murein transglycosylase [Haematospirillum sp. 15-248]NKD87000.1 lytic murein transglycosylase [Haematospirillum sp. 15-248]